MKIKYTLSTFILLVITLITYAQPRSFSKDPAVFIEQLNSYINTSKLPTDAETQKLFNEKWNTGIYPEEEQRVVIKVCNQMLMNEHAISDFVLLEETVLAGKDSIDVDIYDNWMNAIYPASKLGNQTFMTLLTASKNLFKYNLIYQSETNKWYSSTNNYKFQFNKDRVRIFFSDIDLICQANSDKIVIYNTSGSYYLDKDFWEGEKGKVTWERVGLGPDNIYAIIQGKYTTRFDRAELEVDSVMFTNVDFLAEPIMGNLKDRASSANNISEEKLLDSQFPQFTSHRSDMMLGSYLDGQVRFRGGYGMKGREIVANGSADNPSQLEIDYKGTLRVLARSSNFSLKENKISSLKTEITIYTDSGEIYHPNIKLNLNLGDQLLLLTRGKEGLQQAPFFDTDHEVEIYVDRVIWKLELPKIDFDMEVNESAAIIESSNFYKDVRYEKIPRGMLAYHPLSKMRDYVIRFRAREFTFTEYAGWMGSKQTYLKPQIIELADLGYIFYNADNDSIKVRKKLDHAVLSHMKLADYDVIRFTSVIAARPNGFLNLINNTFVLEGVRAFRFSDSQSVYAFPHEQTVILKSKKRMEFGGRVTAGKFDFYAQRFDFDYFDFDITSDHIDSMRIYTPDFEGTNKLIAVKSVLRDINGTLEIDKSTNKSGLGDFPEYPIFTSRKGAKIAYDKANLYNGAYNKDEFYFEVDPFTIDSLDNFTTAGLTFPGTFVSGGILPEFRYQASIMDDYSLGFERANPPGGYPMYGGIGHGDIDIKLSEEGFEAKGTIEYAGSEITSNNIVMMPDSTIAEAESYVIKENDKYPNVFARDVLTRWHPKSDSLYVNTQGHTVEVLREKQNFNGNLVQTSKQLAGNGALTWDEATLTSKDMKFKPNKVDADQSTIEIGAINSEKIAFASYNVESHVDFTSRIGEFKANEKGKLTDFPFNSFASSMDEYTWDMNAKTIELNKGPLLATEKSYFISKKHDQQGLKFQSTNALFDMTEGIIYAKEVPYIDVADSRVFPFEEKVVIEEDADIRPLEQSKVLAARDNKYHEIFDAKMKILGRYKMAGEGSYEFKDKHLTGQIIYFNKFEVRGDSTVVAEGYIKDSLQFTVSPKFAYKGLCVMNSQEEFIRFDGYVKPLHSFEEYESEFFRYKQQPDPSDVIIPAYRPVNMNKRRLFATVSIANDSTHVYSTFAHEKRSYADMELTQDTGVMFYDEGEQTFYVGDSMKLFGGAPRGSFLSFNDATGGIYSEGKINFGLDMDENFNGITAGNVLREKGDTAYTINMLMGLNMNLPKGCFDRIVQVVQSNGEDNPDAIHDNTFTTNAVAEFVDAKGLNKALEQQAQGKIIPTGDLDVDILLSYVSMFYDHPKKAFVAYGPIQIATVAGQQINKEVDAKLVILKQRSSVRITLYIEISKYDWFYIDYYRGSMNVASTDKEFNDLILEQGPKLSKGKYRIRSASPRTVGNFLEKLEPEEEDK